ncbi:MAG: hypothetical protein DWQ04_30695 [Chloroflexi bacterium]|nr:MAG: hypothetical protein DWQ04_30695 [Chloroflexota bacterium]
MTALHQLHEVRQSTWLNYMRRAFIRSGGLRERMADGIQGITANAAAFEKTLSACSDYDNAVRREMTAGTPVRQIHEILMIDDVQRTADLLHPIFQDSKGLDGFASLELDPSISIDPVKTVSEVRHVTRRLDRGNVMVEVPATPTGIEAIKLLIGDGVCINATHIFSIDIYEKVAEAYIAGLEYYFRTHSVWRIAPTAVASFSLSSIDHAIDPLLEAKGYPELKGKTAVAMAKVLYGRFRNIFAGPRWEKLANQGARVLRPKWTRTDPHNFALSDTHYVDALIGPDTVMTFSQTTLNAFLDHGTIAHTLVHNYEASLTHLRKLVELGIDRKAVGKKLQTDYFVASDKRFQSSIQSVINKRDAIEINWQPIEWRLGKLQRKVNESLNHICKERVMYRIWAHDHTVWQKDDETIRGRLNWLHVIETMQSNVGQINGFVEQALLDGFTHMILIFENEGNQAATLFHRAFGKPSKPTYMPHNHLELVKFNAGTTPSPADVFLTKPERTLFVVAAKSKLNDGTMTTFNHFYNWVSSELGAEAAGKHFVAITDPNSKIVELAATYDFRQVFLNDPGVNGRYAALTYFGLLPAALVGTDIDLLLTRASGMSCNSETCFKGEIQANLAAQLGIALGNLAQSGKKQLVLVASSALKGFDKWVGQLIEESIGLPTQIGQPPSDNHHNEQIFVQLRLAGDATHDAFIRSMSDAGHPVIVLHWKDLYDVGGQFFLWQMGTAVAAHLLNVNPFTVKSKAVAH